MKKVSVRLFFTVLWKGICQVLGWFFGLFGYKREGMFAKCVWGLFATSAAIIVGTIALMIIWTFGECAYRKHYKEAHCYDASCGFAEYISENVYFHNRENGSGYIFNSQTGEKTVKDVVWIAEPEQDDSLVCFSNGKKRGYFSKHTGMLVIEPKYSHAWIFSEGIASVEEDGYIKFIDATGQVVFDKQIPYKSNMKGYVFHGGYCEVTTDDGKRHGLMDKKGNIVLPLEYSSIDPTNDYEQWSVTKGEETAVLDNDMKTIIPFTECNIYIGEGTIDMIMPDHTMRKYDLQGHLINDFVISGVRTLEYEKDEILYRTRTHDEDGDEYAEPIVESYRPKAIARMRAYTAGGYEGLMTADGHIVTMPLYKNIEPMGYDLYLCEVTNYDKVIVNGKGEIVR